MRLALVALLVALLVDADVLQEEAVAADAIEATVDTATPEVGSNPERSSKIGS